MSIEELDIKVVPTTKVLPETGLEAIDVILQLSVAETLNVTAALQLPRSLVCVTFDGQVIIGVWLSVTVTVNVHDAEFPLKFVTVLVTVVVPTIKGLPDAGLDTTVEIPQLSEVIT